ncbi:YkgJ family cysteine cluster protein [Aquabacterium sp. A7-Y]|uniref:YkgJ family cysteine cluster protein n=1 Tax=Aquabacterium sp. A7-Y TaxID=1349605 RepID=UPI00223E1AEF|nr:YkgJ family cysteine cluster protein [Aquabacterium sp. A7-Y]MCW7540295.1 YkgJ family cysteine cluster protein [Aquabacterium sp. A7-Y]
MNETATSSSTSWEATALKVLAEEYQNAAGAAGDPAEATRRYFRRYEIRAASMPDDGTEVPACAKGCSYCCHLRVSAPAQEVFTLAEALEQLPDAAQRAALLARVRDNAARVATMDSRRHHGTALRCAVLAADGACSAYEARPSSCRRYHSLSVEACKASFDAPSDLGSRIRLSTPKLVLDTAHYLGHRRALSDAGRDTRQYELHTALCEALDDPQGSRERFGRGEPAFRHAVVTAEGVHAL